MLSYQINNNANGDVWKDILVILNGNNTAREIKIPEGNWTLAVDGYHVNGNGIKEFAKKISVPGTTAYVLYKLN